MLLGMILVQLSGVLGAPPSSMTAIGMCSRLGFQDQVRFLSVEQVLSQLESCWLLPSCTCHYCTFSINAPCCVLSQFIDVIAGQEKLPKYQRLLLITAFGGPCHNFLGKKDYAVNAAFVRDQADLCHAEVVCDQEIT